MKKLLLAILVAVVAATSAFAFILPANQPKLVASLNMTIGDDGFRFSSLGVQVELPVYADIVYFDESDYRLPLSCLFKAGYVWSLDGDASKGGIVASLMAGVVPVVGDGALCVNIGATSRFTFVGGEFRYAVGATLEAGLNFPYERFDTNGGRIYVSPTTMLNVKYMFLDTTGTDPFSIGLDAGAMVWLRNKS